MSIFVLSTVKHGFTGLHVGDIIEYPFRSGHPWRITAIDEGADRITLDDVESVPVRRPGRASLPEEPQ